jgi:hypothetical protein
MSLILPNTLTDKCANASANLIGCEMPRSETDEV